MNSGAHTAEFSTFLGLLYDYTLCIHCLQMTKCVTVTQCCFAWPEYISVWEKYLQSTSSTTEANAGFCVSKYPGNRKFGKEGSRLWFSCSVKHVLSKVAKGNRLISYYPKWTHGLKYLWAQCGFVWETGFKNHHLFIFFSVFVNENVCFSDERHSDCFSFSESFLSGLNVGCFYAVGTLLNRMIIAHYPVSTRMQQPSQADTACADQTSDSACANQTAVCGFVFSSVLYS